MLFVPISEGLGEAILWPGGVWPRAHWGGWHDPLQLLADFVFGLLVPMVRKLVAPQRR